MRVLTLFAVLVAAVPVCGADIGDPVPVYRTELDVLRDSFVTVSTQRSGGSGVVAYSEPGRSLVFTCWHVVQDGTPVTVRSGGAVLSARVVESDRVADIALLEVGKELPAVPAVQFDAPKTGDPVLMLGAASIWSRGKLTEGTDDRTFPSATGDFLGTQGDSGGPVFVRGQLVGLVRGKADEGAKVSTCLGAILNRGINRQKAAVVSVAPSSIGDPVPMKFAPSGDFTKSVKPANFAECPNGVCPLPSRSTYAAPVLSSCPGGVCPAPSYAPVRAGLFGLRRW